MIGSDGQSPLGGARPSADLNGGCANGNGSGNHRRDVQIQRGAADGGDREGLHLSPRLRRVLEQLKSGQGEKQVAAGLNLSQHTVHEYVKRLYRLFGVNSRSELLSHFIHRAGGVNGNGRASGLVNGHANGLANGHANGRANGRANGHAATVAPERASSGAGRLPEVEEEQVYYCVRLLERKGFFVRVRAAAGQAVTGRRGVAAAGAMLLLCLIGLTAWRLDGGRDAFPSGSPAGGAGAAPVAAVVERPSRAGYPKPFLAGTRADGKWVKVTDVKLYETVTVAIDGPADDVTVRLGPIRLMPGETTVVRTPDELTIRTPPGRPPVIVQVTIDRKE